MENIFELLKTEDPIGGLYVHLLQPKERIQEPGKIILPGMSVIKPGKFTQKLSGRIKTYLSNDYWHFDNKVAAFKKVTTRSFLIFNATDLPNEHKWLITGLEEKLIQLITEQFKIISKIGKGKSEYRQIEFDGFEEYDRKIRIISDEINNLANRIIKL